VAPADLADLFSAFQCWFEITFATSVPVPGGGSWGPQKVGNGRRGVIGPNPIGGYSADLFHLRVGIGSASLPLQPPLLAPLTVLGLDGPDRVQAESTIAVFLKPVPEAGPARLVVAALNTEAG
jgi:hypothetical protein